jgi:hypothetical protein
VLDYLEVKVTVDVLKHADETWDLVLLDRGYSARALAGDADGKGGTISWSGQFSHLSSRAPQRRLADADGMPISEPVLLNGQGQPLNLSVATPEPFFGQWRYYEEAEFETLSFFTGILT